MAPGSLNNLLCTSCLVLGLAGMTAATFEVTRPAGTNPAGATRLLRGCSVSATTEPNEYLISACDYEISGREYHTPDQFVAFRGSGQIGVDDAPGIFTRDNLLHRKGEVPLAAIVESSGVEELRELPTRSY